MGIESADTFTEDERQAIPHLPLESKWAPLEGRFELSVERLAEIEEDLGVAG